MRFKFLILLLLGLSLIAMNQGRALGQAGMPATAQPALTAANPWLNILLSALAVGGVAMGVVAKLETAEVKASAAEIVADVKDWKNPSVPFTVKTEKLVADVAGLVAALPINPPPSPAG